MKSRLAVLACALAACQSTHDAPPTPARAPGSAVAAPAPGPAQVPSPAMPAPTAASGAADPWAKSQQPEPKDPLPHPLFWSIEKDGKTTYVLGTIHMGVDPETRLPDFVWKDLDAAPAFAMETDLSDTSIMSSFQRKSGTLHEELGPVYWGKLEKAITPQVAKTLDHMKPMVPATLIEMQGLKQTAPMDGVLLEHAKRENKKILYLEPAKLQADVLEKWMDARALKAMLDDSDAKERTGELLDAYVAGDEKKMQALTDDEEANAIKHGYTKDEYAAEMNDLLYKRNASWIDELDQMHESGGGFVAVGAMHLIGPKSVLDLLGQRGYKVTRLTQ